MNNVEIYINDQLVDLEDSEDIVKTFSIGAFGNITARTSNYSNTFKLPLTANNKNVFGSPDVVMSNSTLPYQKYKCEIYVDGVIVVRGFAQLTGVADAISVRVYSGNYDFYSLIKDKLLSDLDLSDYNHVWNLANVAASRTNTSGYIYPLIDYHTDSPNAYIDNVSRQIDVRFMFFSFYIHTLIDKIVSEAGYTISGDLLTNADYLAIAIAFSNDTYQGTNSAEFKALKADPESITSTSSKIQFTNDSTGGGFDTGNNYNTSTYEYTAPQAMTANFRVSLTTKVNPFQARRSGTHVQYTCLIYRERATIAGVVVSQPIGQLNGTTITNVIETGEINILSGDKLWVQIVHGDGIGDDVVTIQPESFFTVVVASLSAFLGTINVSTNMPNIKQGDFLKSILMKFGAYIQVNNDTLEIEVKQFSEIAGDLSNAVDWSDKLDESEEAQIQFSLANYAQRNNFTYKDDETVIKPTGTDWTLLVLDDNIEASTDLLKDFFAASSQVTRLNGLNLVQIKKCTAGVINAQKTQPRIVYIRRESGTTLTYTDGTSTVTTTTNFPLTHFIIDGRSFNLGWANNLQDNLAEIANCLDRAKVLTLLVRLNSADINKLDFFKPVYIEKYSCHFFISQVKQYKMNKVESTLVELVKLN